MRQERQGLDRLARALRGISVGLALAGGARKAWPTSACCTRWKRGRTVIRRQNVGHIAAGAMAGILYASGMSPEQAIKNFRSKDSTAHAAFLPLPKWPKLVPSVSQCRLLRLGRHVEEIFSAIGDWSNCQFRSMPLRSILVQVSNGGASATGDAVYAGSSKASTC